MRCVQHPVATLQAKKKRRAHDNDATAPPIRLFSMQHTRQGHLPAAAAAAEEEAAIRSGNSSRGSNTQEQQQSMQRQRQHSNSGSNTQQQQLQHTAAAAARHGSSTSRQQHSRPVRFLGTLAALTHASYVARCTYARTAGNTHSHLHTHTHTHLKLMPHTFYAQLQLAATVCCVQQLAAEPKKKIR